MKQNTAQSQAISAQHKHIDATDAHTIHAPAFARQLRALGQALEKFSFSAFDIELSSGTYVVKGRAIPGERVKFSFSRFVRELFRGSKARPILTFSNGRVDLRFSPEEIEGFDVHGRRRRRDSKKMPDPYSISQILRGAGSYLDNRSVTALIGVSLKGKWVTVNYQTADGRLERAQQDLEYFYDYWVKMYLRRSNRIKIPPPSDPTVLLTWQGIQHTPGASGAR